MFSSTSYAGWTKVSFLDEGVNFYVDFERIRKHGGYIYYWSLSDYLKPSPEGNLSAKSYTQGDCKLFRAMTLSEHRYTGPMGSGNLRVWTPNESQKRWIYAPPRSVMEEKLKAVCRYAN